MVLVRGERELASWPLLDGSRRDLAIVDRLARLQLVARRIGCTIRLRGGCDNLLGLLDLAGLADVVPPEDRLAVEVGGKPEGGEQPGVEEVVMPDDPAT